MKLLLKSLLLGVLFISTARASTLADSFRENGFSCKNNGSGDGSICKEGKLYVLIPSGLEQPKRIVFYAHGNLGVCQGGLSGERYLADQMPALLRNGAIAILPHREVPSDSSYPLTRVAERIERIIGGPVDSWSVAGHSSAGKFLGLVLANAPSVLKRVDQALLLDAAYDVDSVMLPAWERVLAANPSIKIRCLSSTTSAKAAGFVNKLNQRFPDAAQNRYVGKIGHCEMTDYFSEL